MENGAIVERMLPGHVAFTNNWEISIIRENEQPRQIVKYPLPKD